MLSAHGFPQKDMDMLTCIAIKESNLNPSAVNKFNRNGTRDHGLFQINDINKKMCGVTSKELLNVHTNVKCAAKVYKVQNLKAWSTYNICKKEVKNVPSNDSGKPKYWSIVYSLRQQGQAEVSERRQSSPRLRREEPSSWTIIGYIPRPN